MHLRLTLAMLLLVAVASSYAQSNTAFDLDVMYIERTPRLNYNPTSPTGGWPASGQAVQWVAHLHNWGTQAVPSVGYRWTLDGAVVATGTITGWAAGADTTVSWPWTWEKVRHSLEFELDPAAAITGELTRGNNKLTIDTDALAMGAWVEDSLAAYMHDNQKVYNDGANSFEDYIQRNMVLWNKMMVDAVYPTAPGGMTDRVRLDEVVHVSDGALPLAGGGYATNYPDLRDQTVDLMWGFPYHSTDVGAGNYYDPVPGNPFQYEFGLLHELDHARYLIDSYGFDVHDLAVQNVTDGAGNYLMGTAAMARESSSGFVHSDKYKGLMDSTHYYSEYEAYEWNRIAGQRARYGNYNAPGDIGVFLNADLPQNNHFRFVDQSFLPLSGARVELHQARGNADEWYGKVYQDAPDAVYTADSNGSITLPRCPFGSSIEHTYGIANSVMLLVVKSAGGVVRTAFVEASDFNLEYWRGHTTDAWYEVQLNTTSNNALPGLVMPGARGRLAGRVVDTTGAPVASAYVGVHPDGDAYCMTDAAGAWSLSVRAGDPVTVSATRSTSANVVNPLSRQIRVTPAAGSQTLPDMVLPAAVANVVPSNAPISVSPNSHWLGPMTDPAFPATYAEDGGFATRWSTTMVPATFVTRDTPLKFTVTLKSAPSINTLVLHWDSEYARGYRVDVSPDGLNFTRVYSTDMGTGGFHISVGSDFRGVDVIRFPAQTVRTIQLSVTNLNPSVNYDSLWEVQAGLDPTALAQADARRALMIAAGLRAAGPADLEALNLVENPDSPGVVDMRDVAAILREVNGLR